MAEPARAAQQRTADTLALLASEVNCWVATADAAGGTPYLVPLSFWWDGAGLWLATLAASPTAQNLQTNGRARLAFGRTSDVVLIEGTVESLPVSAIADETGDAFAAAAGFDPRRLRREYRYFRVRPTLLQAWRGPNEIRGRDLLRDGRWIAD
ncbi:MAG TPA: pyridoxamine 5'-phosphate oxidase family protein [Dehalococcoidia bacterium]|nr:pyridoxamine 5'-phosphate oxidase family protein [Dehalococcoidia bacterium]